jgi:uncharacterized OsmC-like protein
MMKLLLLFAYLRPTRGKLRRAGFVPARSRVSQQRRGAYNIPPHWRQIMVKVCDCFPELKATTLAREVRYRADPQRRAPEGPQSSLEIKVTSVGGLNERVETRNSKQNFIISEPKHVGGLADAPTPLEYLLSGAVGCYAAVFAFYAAKLGVDYDRFEAVARTDFDVRGHMMPDAPPSGFQKVTIAIEVKSNAPIEKLQEVERLALAGCPGIATLRDPVPVATTLSVSR